MVSQDYHGTDHGVNGKSGLLRTDHGVNGKSGL
jgi:hypothetical protein